MVTHMFFKYIEVYLEVVNFGDTVLSKTCQVPTSLVNADIGDIYEYHEKGGGWDVNTKATSV